MRINHNISALNTNNQLMKNNNATSSSLAKLSSGLRINSAADDAAGLAISEKMRGQISGLDQAQSNANDGISMIQTAEGALSETHSILQRMRELAVQSANDTNTDDDRQQMQQEIDQLTSEITRISTDTEFNTKKLLDGSMGTTVTSSAVAVISSGTATGPVASGTYTATVDVTAATGTFVSAGAGMNTIAGNVNFSNTTLEAGQYSLIVSGWGADGTASTLTLQDANGTTIGTPQTNVDLTGASAVAGITFAAASIDADGTISFNINSEKTSTVAVTDYLGNAVTGLDLTVADTATDGQTATITVDASKAATFQIGANSGQSTTLSINNMSATALGVNSINLTTQALASSAIDTIDAAITKVSTQRSALGASQNRLEHTINNLSTSSENLSAAESQIRDVDMAKEMTEYTKNNILSQAAQAMLAQANQQPQNVLQLLQ